MVLLLFIVVSIVCGSFVFGPCIVVQNCVPFQACFCNHSAGDEGLVA